MSLNIQRFNIKSGSSGITDSCSGCGRPHNTHPTAKINIKDLALIFLINVFTPIKNTEFLFKLVTFSKSCAIKQKWVFFSEHSVDSRCIAWWSCCDGLCDWRSSMGQISHLHVHRGCTYLLTTTHHHLLSCVYVQLKCSRWIDSSGWKLTIS